ncbi:titin [Asbolus verrucosus]|uniref:Titin n=1 Tax=Asbolus verrucosus TaxID=1661398 RepID=A0A482VXE2_ASBVE|nr:titin [Asbolus verrucosus]
MEEALTDPLDISKDSELIKDAQKDLSKVDVLVCGGCHEVYHFVEEFQKHKSSDQCTGTKSLKCENEEKSQIWGFTLWKTKQAQIHKNKGEEVPSSWEIYQKWTKLEQLEKDLWISAGRTLQFCSKIASAKVKEVSVKDEKKIERDPLAIDEGIRSGTKALRTSKDNEKEEYNVEKIVGKRFNPRKRIWEYEVKWENYKEETWEPLSHLENCKALVQEYEEKVKAEKEKEKEKQPAPRGRGRPRLNPSSPSSVKIVQKKPVTPPTTVVITTPGGRPQRTSKQKALNQVKAWCGNISDGEDSGTKRPFDDDDESDDSFEKKIKLEGESEDTDDEEPKTPVRKVAKIVHTYNNGAGRKLPDNVLIPDAKGVVRISQKQLPSLSSGVYIMSKSSGIIKLDPAASKIATSGGQAIVKVSPKIGQTQIRIIKKEDGSKRVVQVKGPEGGTTPTTTATLTPARPPKIIHQVVNKTPVVKKELEKVMKKMEVTPKTPMPKLTAREKEETKFSIGNDEESDDGVEELEFPTDLPLPAPDSPPGEFTLDPFTGKVAGQEYPDPEPEPVINEPGKKETPAETIDNIVKLAAADITEEDLKPDTEPIMVPENNTPTTVTATVASTSTAATTTAATSVATANKETLYAVVTEVKTGQSILNTALANSNILQKTLQSPAPRPKTQPRIINQTVAKPRMSMNPIVRTPRPNLVRPKQHILPKPKFNIAPMNPANVRNVYSKTNNVAKKIGNTTVYKTKAPTPVKKSPQKATASTPIAPKPVINMPSLDEEPVVVTPKVEAPVATVEADLSTFTLAAGDRPMFITGDDGTVYQVAGQNEEGQTILLTQDSDGQQQCLLVTNEAIQEEVEQVDNPAEVLMEVQEPVEISEEQPLVAQFIRTEPPSPGGTHKVVVMLPDGDVMVTQVTPEEYASLELDK